MQGNMTTWPGGKRVAVLVSVLFESWSEGKSPSYFPRTTPLKPGTTDRGGIQWAEFGANEGIWRILHLLDRHKVPATVLASGITGLQQLGVDTFIQQLFYGGALVLAVAASQLIRRRQAIEFNPTE